MLNHKVRWIGLCLLSSSLVSAAVEVNVADFGACADDGIDTSMAARAPLEKYRQIDLDLQGFVDKAINTPSPATSGTEGSGGHQYYSQRRRDDLRRNHTSLDHLKLSQCHPERADH